MTLRKTPSKPLVEEAGRVFKDLLNGLDLPGQAGLRVLFSRERVAPFTESLRLSCLFIMPLLQIA